MKANIHPNVHTATITCSCGNSFEAKSTLKEIRVESCNECHPFYTGKQKFGSADGRVERFNKKYNLK